MHTPFDAELTKFDVVSYGEETCFQGSATPPRGQDPTTSGVTPIGQGWTNARGLRGLGNVALYPFLCIYSNGNYSNLLDRQFCFNGKV